MSYLVFNIGLLILIQMHLEQSSSVKTESDSLADDFCRIDEVIKDSAVYSDQSAATRTFLLLLIHFPSRLGQNPPLGNEGDVFARELFLKFANQASLDLLEGLQLGHWNEEYNSLLSMSNLHLLSSSDVQFSQMTLEVGVHFQIPKSLGDRLFKVIGSVAIWLQNLGTSCERHLKKGHS